ncbi:sodium:solute symporter family protein [Sulfobacillus harzensis]|uniref:Sodium:solute symporter family protein n=1 Tax=Sulfobacillus harzensis TaxID=2729629 RepID=A0A7Y0L7U8_9FIRM|nr:sodium:solute symporter family protein [Sulfobacillus harzensis]NMP24613.1 sodium:solute symporter family protein [Sulfobacillus harzensis]
MAQGAWILLIALLAVIAVTVGGIIYGHRQSRDLSGWLVDARRMGPFLVWFLLGTEIYTAFTFQGLAAYSYANGSAAYYNVALNDVAYALGFFILPAFWLLGKRFGHVTQSDFVASRYQSPGLGIFIAFTTALIMIGYIDLNIEGLGAVVTVISGGSVHGVWPDVLGFLVLGLAVTFGGIRGNAWQSAIKDILMFIAILALFFVVPSHFFHGFGSMFQAFHRKLASRMVLPGINPKLGILWLITTVMLTSMGQWMWPQWFGIAYTARGPRALKLQAVFMPLYQLVKWMVIVIGFAAVLILGFHKTEGNNVVMMLAGQALPFWMLALFTIAAVFSAIIPAGPIIMTSAGLLARNVYQKLWPKTTDVTTYRLTRALVLPITFLALVLAEVAPALIVVVLLVAYDFIAQLFPAIVIGGLFWKRATKEGALAGILGGWIVAAWVLLTKHDPWHGMNAGFIALLVNLVLFFGVSLLTQPAPRPFLDQFFATIYPKTDSDQM